MCKILVFTNVAKVKDIKKLTNAAAEELLAWEKDGFGYAIQGEKGVYGERTTRDTFKTRLSKLDLVVKEPIFTQTWNNFGVESQAKGAALYHGRTSTNDKNLTNTHPIMRNDWTLIHNGVVTNLGPKYVKNTTNDTEDLVHYMSTEGIKSVEKNLSGYYAFASLDPKGNLHVVKDETAKLFCAWIKALDSLVFATNEDIITDVCKVMKYKVGPIEQVQDNIYMIFDSTGKLTHVQNITPKGYTYNESKHASRSLGAALGHKTESHFLNKSYYDDYQSNVYDVSYDAIDTERENSYYAWLTEVENMDGSYTVLDEDEQRIELGEFRTMNEIQKTKCTIIRGDGTVCDHKDYFTERLHTRGA